jgi:hypothetical protein
MERQENRASLIQHIIERSGGGKKEEWMNTTNSSIGEKEAAPLPHGYRPSPVCTGEED